VPLYADRDLWRDGNALTRVGEVPSLPVFRGHGDRDELVPMSSTTSVGTALERAGHPVHIAIVTGAGHHDI
jgi:predicted esterase